MSDIIDLNEERYARCCTKGTRLSIFPNGREGVRDDGNEEVDQPEVENHNNNNEEDTRDEELCVDHIVHHRSPLVE